MSAFKRYFCCYLTIFLSAIVTEIWSKPYAKSVKIVKKNQTKSLKTQGGNTFVVFAESWSNLPDFSSIIFITHILAFIFCGICLQADVSLA